MTSRLGAVIPVHGPIEPVLPLLNSLVGGSTPSDGRPALVVVVDDATAEPVDPNALPPGVELVRRATNGGFGAAVNTGLDRLAREGLDLALVLNSDLRVPDGFVRDLVAHAQPWQPAVVGCRAEGPDGISGHSARYFPTASHQIIEWLVPLASQRHRDVLHRAVGHDMAAERGTGMIPVDWVSGAVMLLPLTQVREVGGLDELYFMYAEEVDLQRRLRAVGVPSLYDADLTVTHVGGGSSGGEARRRQWLVAGRDRYARLHGRPRTLRTGLRAATLANLAWNTGRRVAGRDVTPLAAFREQWGVISDAARGTVAERNRR